MQYIFIITTDKAKMPIKIIDFKIKKINEKKKRKNENITISFHSETIKIKIHQTNIK